MVPSSFLQTLRVEIVPSKDAATRLLREYPPPAAISVAALPRHEMSATIETAVMLRLEGYAVTAHLPARAYDGETHLRGDLERLARGGVQDLLVISGDNSTALQAFPSSTELAATVQELLPGTFSLGVAGYPQGHPVNGHSLRALHAKQQHATSLTTQMCFATDELATYLDLLASASVTLPVWVGVPGPVSRMRLMQLAAKVGVSTSMAQLGKTQDLARQLLSAPRFDPLPFLASLAHRSESTRIHGLHLFSFNDFSNLSRLVEDLAELHESAASDQGQGSFRGESVG